MSTHEEAVDAVQAALRKAMQREPSQDEKDAEKAVQDAGGYEAYKASLDQQ